MRIRLQVLLPAALGLLVGLGFLAAALAATAAVGDALGGLTAGARDRAVEAARDALLRWGGAATAAVVVASALVARMVALALARVRESARALAAPRADDGPRSPVAEVQDVARGLDEGAGELRARHGRVSLERDELAALVESVSEGIIQLDPDGRIVRVNRAGRLLLGLHDDAAGRPIAAMVRNPEVRRLMVRTTRGDHAGPSELRLDERRVLVSVARQPDGGVVASVMDVTDLRRLEEIRRDFVANASHELKTPLTSIRGYTETLLEGDLPADDRRQFLATIARNAERLQRIVDDLLDLSRVESGTWAPELEPLELRSVAEDAWRPFASRAETRDVAFSTAGDPDVRGLAERDALEQVFANLYDNALRHTPPGGRITVRVARAADTEGGGGPAAAGWAVAEVVDTGSGIPRDALPRIFERFYRVEPARSRAEGGTGLGLSIVRHLVERLGGAVEAESRIGRGATFRIRLPAA